MGVGHAVRAEGLRYPVSIRTAAQHTDEEGREYEVVLPIGVDMPTENDPLPRTFTQLQMSGTPTLLLVDRRGELRANRFGGLDDLELGALIGRCMRDP